MLRIPGRGAAAQGQWEQRMLSIPGRGATSGGQRMLSIPAATAVSLSRRTCATFRDFPVGPLSVSLWVLLGCSEIWAGGARKRLKEPRVPRALPLPTVCVWL